MVYSESLVHYIKQLEAKQCPHCCPTKSVREERPEEPTEYPTSDCSTGLYRDAGSSDKAEEPAEEAFDTPLADQLMQQEMQSLRRALFEMQRERFEHEHAQCVTDQTANAQQTASNRRLETELDQAETQVSLLQQECARLLESKSHYEELAQRLQHDTRRLKREQRESSDAQAAENEILRKQLEIVEKKVAKLQSELSSMHHQAQSEY